MILNTKITELFLLGRINNEESLEKISNYKIFFERNILNEY